MIYKTNGNKQTRKYKRNMRGGGDNDPGTELLVKIGLGLLVLGVLIFYLVYLLIYVILVLYLKYYYMNFFSQKLFNSLVINIFSVLYGSNGDYW